VPTVQEDARLSLTAERYAGQLAARGSLSHRGNDGSSDLDRYRACGGTEVRVGEILGAGPAEGLIESAWMASADHRQVALSAGWTHAGWGAARSGSSLVMVMMFTTRLVDGLSFQTDGLDFTAAGRFVPVQAAAAVLLNGLVEVSPIEWNPASRAFRFELPRAALEGYLRLGYLTARGELVLTNALVLPLDPPR